MESNTEPNKPCVTCDTALRELSERIDRIEKTYQDCVMRRNTKNTSSLISATIRSSWVLPQLAVRWIMACVRKNVGVGRARGMP